MRGPAGSVVRADRSPLTTAPDLPGHGDEGTGQHSRDVQQPPPIKDPPRDPLREAGSSPPRLPGLNWANLRQSVAEPDAQRGNCSGDLRRSDSWRCRERRPGPGARAVDATDQVREVDGDPLGDPTARDWAARDYRTHLQTVAKRKPSTINAHLTAVDDFYGVRRQHKDPTD